MSNPALYLTPSGSMTTVATGNAPLFIDAATRELTVVSAGNPAAFWSSATGGLTTSATA